MSDTGPLLEGFILINNREKWALATKVHVMNSILNTSMNLSRGKTTALIMNIKPSITLKMTFPINIDKTSTTTCTPNRLTSKLTPSTLAIKSSTTFPNEINNVELLNDHYVRRKLLNEPSYDDDSDTNKGKTSLIDGILGLDLENEKFQKADNELSNSISFDNQILDGSGESTIDTTEVPVKPEGLEPKYYRGYRLSSMLMPNMTMEASHR
ncbi:unnamed protein product, partial [Didymodactylos carnosus]